MTAKEIQIEEALNLAQCELRAMYKRVGIKGSNVLDKVDEAWKVVKNFRQPDVSDMLFLELAIRTQRELPIHEDELRWWNEETNVYQCGDFTSRYEDEIAR